MASEIREQKWSHSWVISDSRESMTQIADELKSNDIDIISNANGSMRTFNFDFLILWKYKKIYFLEK